MVCSLVAAYMDEYEGEEKYHKPKSGKTDKRNKERQDYIKASDIMRMQHKGMISENVYKLFFTLVTDSSIKFRDKGDEIEAIHPDYGTTFLSFGKKDCQAVFYKSEYVGMRSIDNLKKVICDNNFDLSVKERRDAARSIDEYVN